VAGVDHRRAAFEPLCVEAVGQAVLGAGPSLTHVDGVAQRGDPACGPPQLIRAPTRIFTVEGSSDRPRGDSLRRRESSRGAWPSASITGAGARSTSAWSVERVAGEAVVAEAHSVASARARRRRRQPRPESELSFVLSAPGGAVG
jgi:hypothetical protein